MRRLLREQVERLRAVQDAEVGGLPGAVDQPAQQRPGQPLERVVPQVGRAQLERADPEPVPALLGQVRHEAGLGQLGEQVVRRRPGQPQLARHRRRGHRAGLAGQQPQHRQAAPQRRHIAASPPSVWDTRQCHPRPGSCDAAGAAVGWAHEDPVLRRTAGR